MNAALLRAAARLHEQRAPYALATVVRREPPTSAQVGDAALVTADGGFQGWVGGSCTRPTVVREALAALADGLPRLIALDPDPDAVRGAGVKVLPMTCHSRGRVDVYIEPILPTPALYVFGVAPAARALARLGAAMGYEVTAVDPDADVGAFPDAAVLVDSLAAPDPPQQPREVTAGPKRRTFAVVATQGGWDAAATAQALSLGPDYVGVIASRRRFEEIRAHLEREGFDAAAVGRIANPAGLDIGARTAEEIAVSILAEIVQTAGRAARARDPEVGKGSGTAAAGAGPGSPLSGARGREGAAPEVSTGVAGRGPVHAGGPRLPEAAGAIDPICGMSVVPAPGTPSADHDGRRYYFCCGHCRERFLRDPAAHAAEPEA